MSTATVLPFAGGELSSLDALDNGTIEQSISAVFDAVSRCAIRVGCGSAGARTPSWDDATDFWLHVYWGVNTATGDAVLLYNGATVVAKLTMASNVVTVSTLQGGVMTAVNTFDLFVSGVATANVVDIRIQAGGAATVSAYLAGTNIFTVTGLDHSDFAGITQVLFLGPANGGLNPQYYSQIICDDGVSHVGDALVTLVEDTASVVNTGWSGDVSGINETILDDSHSVISSAAGDVGTYYKNGASLGAYNVLAICIGARAQLTTGSSTNLQVCLRTNGSNYFSPTVALDFGFQAVCASWRQNPFTAANWDPVTAAAVEVGMKSVA